MLLKEETQPPYQSSQFFETYANSNKMSGPLHVRINGYILYQFNLDNTSFALFSLHYLLTYKFFLIDKTKEYIGLTKFLPTMTSV